MSATPWIATQLIRMADGRTSMGVEQPRYNPRPPGVIRAGGASDAVISFLQQNPKRFYRHHEIRADVGRTKVSIDWALCYLVGIGQIEQCSDAIRNSRYKKYRVRL